MNDFTLAHVSASQISSFRACQRRWFFEKVMKLATPSTGSQALGTLVHGSIEHWIEHGTFPDPENDARQLANEIASRSVHLLPPRGPGLIVERDMGEWPLYAAGVLVKGRIDLIDLTDKAFPHILDHKTTSRISYAKTEEDLQTDPQLLIYAKWALERYPTAANVSTSLVYYPTKTKKAGLIRTIKRSKGQIDSAWPSIVETVREIQTVAKCESPKDVTPNFSHCSAYGGCPFKETCLTPKEAFLMKFQKPEKKTDAVIAVGINPPDAAKQETAAAVEVVPSAPSDTVTGQAEKHVLLTYAPEKTEPLLALANKQPVVSELILFVDCAPVLGYRGARTLESIIGTHQEELCKALGILDLRQLEYGKGKAALAASLRTNMPSGVVVARSGDLADTAIEILSEKAALVVRGNR